MGEREKKNVEKKEEAKDEEEEKGKKINKVSICLKLKNTKRV